MLRLLNLKGFGTPERIRTSDLLLRSLALTAYIVDSWSGLGWFPSPVRVSPALIAQHNEQRLFVPGALPDEHIRSHRADLASPIGRHGFDHLAVVEVLSC